MEQFLEAQRGRFDAVVAGDPHRAALKLIANLTQRERMGARLWPGGDMVLNAESVVAKPESEPYAWGVRLTLRQFW